MWFFISLLLLLHGHGIFHWKSYQAQEVRTPSIGIGFDPVISVFPKEKAFAIELSKVLQSFNLSLL
jgi:hypothetical protein